MNDDEFQQSDQPAQEPTGPEGVQFQTPEESPGEGERRTFWQRNGATIITVAILGLIIGGAIAVNEQRKSGNDLVGQNQEDTMTEEEQPQTDEDGLIAGGDSDQLDQTEDQQDAGDAIERIAAAAIALRITGDQDVVETEQGRQIVVDDNLTIRVTESEVETRIASVEVSAVRGNGRTHLARRAITQTLRRTDIDLNQEQRVFAEDFLQKLHAPATLHPGTTLIFTGNQISDAISAAQSLTPAQLENLQKWSALVNWPPI